jgi:hypothetical protein
MTNKKQNNHKSIKLNRIYDTIYDTIYDAIYEVFASNEAFVKFIVHH